MKSIIWFVITVLDFPSCCWAFTGIMSIQRKCTKLQHHTDKENNRRRILIQKSTLLFPFWYPGVAHPKPEDIQAYPTDLLRDDNFLSSLVYEKKLGSGSYKTVYLVSSESNAAYSKIKLALAVERLRFRSDARDATQGIQIAQELEKYQFPKNDRHMFEQVLTWWVQQLSPNEFIPGKPVLQRSDLASKRTQKVPGKFLGSLWLLSIKPVYEMDLKRFSQKLPTLYPIDEKRKRISSGSSNRGTIISNEKIQVIAGISLDDEGAIGLSRDLCQIMGCMQEIGMVHRDIKPKNIMLTQGSPVIIDFGFSDILQRNKNGECCIMEPGRVVGELEYVLAKDIAKNRGCQDGDRYAMAKTMYGTLFGPAISVQGDKSSKKGLSKSDVVIKNNSFWSEIRSNAAFSQSRFHLTSSARDVLAKVIRALALPAQYDTTFAKIDGIFEEWMIENTARPS